MATRNILDKDGNIIGEMTLPDETTEEEWLDKLTPYAYVKPNLTLQQVIDTKVSASIVFGLEIIKNAATENVITGITAANKTREVSDYLANLERYLRSGSLYAAISEIDDLMALEIPEDISTWVSIEKLNNTKLKIQKFLGL